MSSTARRPPNRFVKRSTTSAGPSEPRCPPSFPVRTRRASRCSPLSPADPGGAAGDSAASLEGGRVIWAPAAGQKRDHRVESDDQDEDRNPHRWPAKHDDHHDRSRDREQRNQPALPADRPPPEADATTSKPAQRGQVVHATFLPLLADALEARGDAQIEQRSRSARSAPRHWSMNPAGRQGCPQTRVPSGLAAHAPGKNRTCARGLGSRSREQPAVRLSPRSPAAPDPEVHGVRRSTSEYAGVPLLLVDGR